MTRSGMIGHRIVHRLAGDLYVREHAPQKPLGTLVYVHGLGESGLCFEGLLAHPGLGRWRQLVADLPGYGKSPWPQAPLSLGEHAARLAAWLDAEDPGPVVLVGHSMGGALGTLFAEEHPERLRGFVNVEGNLSYEDCQFSGKAAAHKLDDFLARERELVLDEVYREGQGDPALRVYYPSLRMCDPCTFHRNSVELVELSRKDTLASRLAALAAPSVYLLGHPRGVGEYSCGLLDRAGVSWHQVDDAGHWPFLDQPDAFVGQLLAFLEGL